MRNTIGAPTKMIPVANPHAQFLRHDARIREAIDRVLKSGWYILGREVESFEKEFADFLKAEYCVSVANGTDALALALQAVGVHPGDKVVTVSHSAVATVAAIEQIGAVPVLVDIDAKSWCLSPEALKEIVSSEIKAIVPVHIYGQPADMPKIMQIAREHGIPVVEDCAQAHGAEINGRAVGTFGEAAAFSFYPTKNLGAIGDGGAVITNSHDVFKKLMALRQYGWEERYISAVPGVNSRLDEMQAAILRVKLPFLKEDNERRREIAQHYKEVLQSANVEFQAEMPDSLHAMHLFVISTEKREELARFLKEKGVATAHHYPQAIHQQPAYTDKIEGGKNLPNTERLYTTILTLPMFPELTGEQVETVSRALNEWTLNEKNT